MIGKIALIREWLKHLPVGVFGMLGLVLMVERMIDRFDLEFIPAEGWQYRLARWDAADQAKGCDLLAFGDSLTKFSVLPKVIDEQSGLRVYNLAMCGSQAPASYYLLRRVIDRGTAPRAMVVNFHPRLLMGSPKTNSRNWPLLLSFRETLELAWLMNDAECLGELVLNRFIASLRDRQTIRQWVVEQLKDKPTHAGNETAVYLRLWRENSGAHVMPSREVQDSVTVKHTQEVFFPSDWFCHPVNEVYVRRFLELAQSQGVTVYWTLPLLIPRLQEECERSEFDARYEAFVRNWQERFPNLVVVDGRRTAYPENVFFDHSHLGREGAYIHSVDLGRKLRERSDDPASARNRWLTLSPYQAWPVDPGLMDLTMTRSAMLNKKKGFVR
jgi:Protein of unknown function (DUF1574)